MKVKQDGIGKDSNKRISRNVLLYFMLINYHNRLYFKKHLCLHYCEEEMYQVVRLSMVSNNLMATGDDCLCAQSLQHVWVFVTLWTVDHQAPLSMGILQARTLQWVVVPASTGSFQPRDSTQVSSISYTGRWPLSHYCHLGSPHIIRIQFKNYYFY